MPNPFERFVRDDASMRLRDTETGLFISVMDAMRLGWQPDGRTPGGCNCPDCRDMEIVRVRAEFAALSAASSSTDPVVRRSVADRETAQWASWTETARGMAGFLELASQSRCCDVCGREVSCGVELPNNDWDRNGNTFLCCRCANNPEYRSDCRICGEFFWRQSMMYVDSTGRVCEACYEEGTYECNNCGSRVRNGEACGCDYEYEDFDLNPEQRTSRMWNHSYVPPLRFWETRQTGPKSSDLAWTSTPKSGRLYLGMELEVESGPRSHFDDCLNKLGMAVDGYAKADGSLSSRGFEFVTHPHTFDAWKLKSAELSDALAWLRKDGCRSYNTTTCGLHLHLSRGAFQGTAHVFKLLQLIYLNPRFIHRLSQRASINAMSRYASLTDVTQLELPKKVLQCAHGDRMGNWNRYTAVNLNNRNTIELRFFRGTLAVEGVYRAIEFAVAATEWTRTISLEEAAHLPAFRQYVYDNAKLYPNLSAWWRGLGNPIAAQSDA